MVPSKSLPIWHYFAPFFWVQRQQKKKRCKRSKKSRVDEHHVGVTKPASGVNERGVRGNGTRIIELNVNYWGTATQFE